MRKLTIVFVILSLLASLIIVSNWHILAVKAADTIYQGDLILNDNNVTIIENKIFHINGSILVEENATLILRNAWINFTQASHYQFNMTFRNPIDGNPRLIAENATITGNGYSLNVYFRDAFTTVNMATVNNLTVIGNLHFFFWHHASATISDSELYYVNLQHNTVLEISDSIIDYIYTSDQAKANITNSETSHITASGSSTITISNCTIDNAEADFNSRCYIYDSTINNGYVYDSARVWLFNVTTTGTGEINDTAIVYIGWYLDVHVTDFVGQAVAGANVTAYYYENDTLAESKLTGTDGWARLTLIAGFINATDFYWTGTYTLLTSYMTVYSNLTFVDMYDNIELTVPLGFFLAYPAYYNGDIILKDNQYLYIEGLLNINGSIIVEENATLFVYNGWINFTQEADSQFDMTFKGNADLIFYNGNITANNYYFMITFENNSTATISDLTTEANIQFVHYSVAEVQDSTLTDIAILQYANVTFSNCIIDQMDISGNTECLLSTSTVTDHLSIGITSANATITDLKPGHISSWNLLQDCLVETSFPSFAPNLTITDTDIDGWIINLYGSSNATILRSTLEIISCHGSSETSVYSSHITIFINTMDEAFCYVQDTPVQMLWLSGESEVWAFNSTVAGIPSISDNAALYIGWWLDIHVTDLENNNVPNANVTIIDSEGHQVAYGKTQSDGRVKFTLLEKLVNATGTYPYGNYIVEAAYEENFNSQQVVMDENQQVTIQLLFIIPELSPATILLVLLTLTLTMLYASKKRKPKYAYH